MRRLVELSSRAVCRRQARRFATASAADFLPIHVHQNQLERLRYRLWSAPLLNADEAISLILAQDEDNGSTMAVEVTEAFVPAGDPFLGFDLHLVEPEVLEFILRALYGNYSLIETPLLITLLGRIHRCCGETCHLLNDLSVVAELIRAVRTRMTGWHLMTLANDNGKLLRETDDYVNAASSVLPLIRFSMAVMLQLLELANVMDTAATYITLKFFFFSAMRSSSNRVAEIFPEPSVAETSRLTAHISHRQLTRAVGYLMCDFVLQKLDVMTAREVSFDRYIEMIEMAVFSRHRQPDQFARAAVKVFEYCPLSDPAQFGKAVFVFSRKRLSSVVTALLLRHLDLMPLLDHETWWPLATAYVMCLGTQRPNPVILRALLTKGTQLRSTLTIEAPNIAALVMLELLAVEANPTAALTATLRESEFALMSTVKERLKRGVLIQMIATIGSSTLELASPTTRAMRQRFLTAVGSALATSLATSFSGSFYDNTTETTRDEDDLPKRHPLIAVSFGRILRLVRRSNIALPELVQVLATGVSVDQLLASRRTNVICFVVIEYILFCQKFSVVSAVPRIMQLTSLWASVLNKDPQQAAVEAARAVDVLDAMRSLRIRHSEIALHLLRAVHRKLIIDQMVADAAQPEEAQDGPAVDEKSFLGDADDEDGDVGVGTMLTAEGLAKAVGAYQWLMVEVPGWHAVVEDAAVRMAGGRATTDRDESP